MLSTSQTIERCFNPRSREASDGLAAEYWSVNALDRYKVAKAPELMICGKYEPTEEQIASEKAEGMDHEAVMLEMLLNVMPTRDVLNRLMPITKGKSIPELVQMYKELDSPNRAYFLACVSQRVGLSDSHATKQKFFIRPNGDKVMVEWAMISGADDI